LIFLFLEEISAAPLAHFWPSLQPSFNRFPNLSLNS